MPETVIIQSDTLQLIVKSTADATAVELLKNTIYGTKGIRYRHTGQAHKVTELHDPYFFHLYIDKQLQGLYCLDHRIIRGNTDIDAFYGRYLTVSEAYQRKGYGRLLKTEAVRYICDLFPMPFLFYSYIENKNTRSVALSQALDFESIATLRTFVFRRLYPAIDKRFSQSNDFSDILPLLKEYYKNYSFTVFTKVFDRKNYFLLRKGNQILAGVHASPVTWQFSRMPGFMGWVMMNGFPRFPILKKLFQPFYSFLALEGIYLLPGNEHLLPVLLESVLAHFEQHTAILLVDSTDKLASLLETDRGWFSGYQKGVSTQVLVKPVGLTDHQYEVIRQGTVYVSSFDFT